jgi:ABC-2 type transport system permease protein
MRNVLLIMRREYLVRVRTKAFLIFTVLLPLLIGAVVVLPNKLMMQSTGTRHVVIVSADAELANSIKAELSAISAPAEDEAMPADSSPGTKKAPKAADFEVSVETAPSEQLRQRLTTQVRHGSIDGFAWVDPNAVITRKGTYYSRNGSDFVEAAQVSRALRFALSERQLAGHGFSAAEAKTLLGPVDVDTVHIDKQGANKSNGMGAFFLPFLLLLAIYMTVLIYGLYVMRSVIEEKSSRVVEVLLGSVTPIELMAGKIIGVGAVGLTQIAIWAAGGILLGSGAVAMIGDTMKDAHVGNTVLILFPVFFILGYATYACLYAAIGAIVNSDDEAQQLQFPVTLPLILCMVFAAAIIRDPNTSLAFWLSMFPLTSPIIMFVRVSQDMPPVWQIALSIAISLVSLYGLIWLTSRIYRVGILMYGKRPTLPEILRWIRYT